MFRARSTLLLPFISRRKMGFFTRQSTSGVRKSKLSKTRLAAHSQHHSGSMSSASETFRKPFLVRFYDPDIGAPDHQGRTLSTILTWSDSKLESCHDYIQTLFPLPEGSAFGWAAPIIDKATFDAFQARPELRARLRDSFIRILSFYGFELQEEGDKARVVRGSFFNVAARNWVTRYNHNHLRITRIIRSLRVLGLESEATAFYEALKELYERCGGRLGQTSMMYWTRAISRPLHVAPDADSDEESDGEDFLYEYDQSVAGTEMGSSRTETEPLSTDKEHVETEEEKSLAEEESVGAEEGESVGTGKKPDGAEKEPVQTGEDKSLGKRKRSVGTEKEPIRTTDEPTTPGAKGSPGSVL
jgi:hypothetical protein